MCWKNCCSQWRVWFRPIVITVYILFVIIIVPTLIVNSGNCTLNHGHKMGKTAGCIFPLDAVVEIAWKKYQTSTDCDTRIHSNRNFSARWIHTQRSVDLNWWLICADRNTNVGVAHQSTHHPFYETRSAETNYTRPMDGSHLCQQCGMWCCPFRKNRVDPIVSFCSGSDFCFRNIRSTLMVCARYTKRMSSTISWSICSTTWYSCRSSFMVQSNRTTISLLFLFSRICKWI